MCERHCSVPLTGIRMPDHSPIKIPPASKYRRLCGKIAESQKYTFFVPPGRPRRMTTRRSHKPELLGDTFIPGSLNHVQESDVRTFVSHAPVYNNEVQNNGN